jgi:hypothetical protein
MGSDCRSEGILLEREHIAKPYHYILALLYPLASRQPERRLETQEP